MDGESWPADKPLLSFVGINKKFGNKVVLNNISFDIYKNELFGLIGSSGAGKTTLLNTLIGYYTPDEGKILYKNQDVTKNKLFIRQIFGFATQENCFYEELTLLDNLFYYGTMYGMSKKVLRERSENLLKMVELWENKNLKAGHLSGGMKRRFDLCISLIHNPELVILDEPTTGLDPLLRKSMWKIIKRINRSGITIIMSSHLLDEMENLCNDVAMIKNGNLLVKGSPDQLKSFYSKNREVFLESYPGNYKKILTSLKSKNVPAYYPRHEGNKLVFYTPDPYQILKIMPSILLLNGEKLNEISIEKPNLSEVFEALSNLK